jgi:hypothetical protein
MELAPPVMLCLISRELYTTTFPKRVLFWTNGSMALNYTYPEQTPNSTNRNQYHPLTENGETDECLSPLEGVRGGSGVGVLQGTEGVQARALLMDELMKR